VPLFLWVNIGVLKSRASGSCFTSRGETLLGMILGDCWHIVKGIDSLIATGGNSAASLNVKLGSINVLLVGLSIRGIVCTSCSVHCPIEALTADCWQGFVDVYMLPSG
jgi:hypothetical protein